MNNVHSHPLKQSIRAKHYLMWLVANLKARLNSSKEYVILSPPSREKQVILRKPTGERFSISLRTLDDWFTLHQIFANEDYDLKRLPRFPALVKRYQEILDSGRTPVILDCGANIGLSLRHFSFLFPKAHIVGVEPHPDNARMARTNAGLPNVQVIQAAVSSRDGNVEIFGNGGENAFRTRESAEGDVRSLSIPSLLAAAQVKDPQPFIVKIDIEGFEQTLFAENTDWIALFDLLIIELHDWLFPGQATSQSFLQAIAREKRDFLFFSENVFSIRN